jgi:hypothetical protein
VQAPFRFARITLFGGLGVGAALGLFVITGRLILSIKGGPGAPALEVGAAFTCWGMRALELATVEATDSWVFALLACINTFQRA